MINLKKGNTLYSFEDIEKKCFEWNSTQNSPISGFEAFVLLKACLVNMKDEIDGDMITLYKDIFEDDEVEALHNLVSKFK